MTDDNKEVSNVINLPVKPNDSYVERGINPLANALRMAGGAPHDALNSGACIDTNNPQKSHTVLPKKEASPENIFLTEIAEINAMFGE